MADRSFQNNYDDVTDRAQRLVAIRGGKKKGPRAPREQGRRRRERLKSLRPQFIALGENNGKPRGKGEDSEEARAPSRSGESSPHQHRVETTGRRSTRPFSIKVIRFERSDAARASWEERWSCHQTFSSSPLKAACGASRDNSASVGASFRRVYEDQNKKRDKLGGKRERREKMSYRARNTTRELAEKRKTGGTENRQR